MPKRPFQVGDVEFRKHPEYPYLIGADGSVHSLVKNRKLKGSRSPRGYPRTTVKSNGKKTTLQHHHAVMLCFVGPRPKGMVINHKNGIKTDNRLENLEYCTPKQNREHAVRMGLYHSGEMCTWSKLNWDCVRLAKQGRRIGFSLNQLSRAFRVSKKAILIMLQDKTWREDGF